MKYNGSFILPTDTETALTIENKAAVLLIICPRQQALLVIHKAEFLRRHAGEIAFPGGKLEHNETLLECAQRECFEEVGLQNDCYELLGRLPQRFTRHQVEVTPFVAVLQTDIELRIDRGELQDAFFVPLAHLQDPKNHHQRQAEIDGQLMALDYYFYQRELKNERMDYKIWGVTAHIISDFLKMEMTF